MTSLLPILGVVFLVFIAGLLVRYGFRRFLSAGAREKTRGAITSVEFATLVALFTIFTGGHVSLYSAELKANWPINWDKTPQEMTAAAVVGWLLFFLTAILFYGRQRAVSDREKLAREQLEELVRTLPPQNFLAQFRAAFANSASLTGPLSSVLEREQRVRFMLKTMATLAMVFDRRPPGARYAANVMLYRTIESIEQEELEALDIQFLAPDQSPQALRGVLVLDHQLSTALPDTSMDIQPDDDLPGTDDAKFALPLPHTAFDLIDGERRTRVLPGGAEAVWSVLDPDGDGEGAVSGHKDAAAMASWCESRGSFDPAVINEIRVFFQPENSQSVRSFVSFPLIQRNTESPSVLGVVNIHSNQANRVATSGKGLNHFAPLMEPFLALVAEVLSDHTP